MKHPKLLTVISAILLALVAISKPALSNTWEAGTKCEAVNLNQAFSLVWNHARIQNTSTTRALWVTCAVGDEIRYQPSADDSSINWQVVSPENLFVYAWFGTSAASNAEVKCILRGFDATNATSTPDSSEGHTMTRSGAAPAVTAQQYAGSIVTFIGARYGTLTCKLDPGTGLNGWKVNYPTPS